MMVLLFGPPGVGKGTQADLLASKYNLLRFSMGDLLREEVAGNSSIGVRARGYLETGKLAPDSLVLEMVEEFLIRNQKMDILFDGFPRNLNQATDLDRSLAQLGLAIDFALELVLSRDEITRRMESRRFCPACGRIYNLMTSPPQSADTCDLCRHRLAKRSDDETDVIGRRFHTYEHETRPLIEHYRTLSVYRRIDASGSPEEVFDKVSTVIDAGTK